VRIGLALLPVAAAAADCAAAQDAAAFLSKATNNCRGCVLSGANLERRDLTGADLSGADLRGVSFSRTILRGADLSGANLAGVSLKRRDLAGARRAPIFGAQAIVPFFAMLIWPARTCAAPISTSRY
jgi:hypothetical protein